MRRGGCSRIRHWRARGSSSGVCGCRRAAWSRWRPVLARTTGHASWLRSGWNCGSSRPNWLSRTGAKVPAARTTPTMRRRSARPLRGRRCASSRSSPSNSKACCACTGCAKASRKTEPRASTASVACWPSSDSCSLKARASCRPCLATCSKTRARAWHACPAHAGTRPVAVARARHAPGMCDERIAAHVKPKMS